METERVRTGVAGLDDILGGGLPAKMSYLLLGRAGTGKTTLGLQFLVDGARRGEKCLYFCFAETQGQLARIAAAFGWTLDGVETHEMRPRGGAVGGKDRAAYTVFQPSEIELEGVLGELLEQIQRIQPTRMVLDSLSGIRLLAEDAYRYRRELLTFIDRLNASNCTALLIDVDEEAGKVSVAETLVNGVFYLEQLTPSYGGSGDVSVFVSCVDRRALAGTTTLSSATAGSTYTPASWPRPIALPIGARRFRAE